MEAFCKRLLIVRRIIDRLSFRLRSRCSRRKEASMHEARPRAEVGYLGSSTGQIDRNRSPRKDLAVLWHSYPVP